MKDEREDNQIRPLDPAREQALRDANRFIRLAAKIIPKPVSRWKEKYVYEANPEAGVALIRLKDTGEVISSRRLCKRKTKTGEACKSFAIGDTDTCIHHATDDELKSFGYSKEKIKRKPRLMLALDALVEDERDRIFGAYVNALDATDFAGNVDHRTRMQAADSLLDRTYGKPTSKQEITGADGDALTLLFTNDPGESTDTE